MYVNDMNYLMMSLSKHLNHSENLTDETALWILEEIPQSNIENNWYTSPSYFNLKIMDS